MPDTLSDVMGDCILHLDHHHMTESCWEAAMGYYLEFLLAGLNSDEARDRYKALYESALLNQIVPIKDEM